MVRRLVRARITFENFSKSNPETSKDIENQVRDKSSISAEIEIEDAVPEDDAESEK